MNEQGKNDKHKTLKNRIWYDIKELYVKSPVRPSMQQLAVLCHVNKSTISRRAKSEGWDVEREQWFEMQRKGTIKRTRKNDIEYALNTDEYFEQCRKIILEHFKISKIMKARLGMLIKEKIETATMKELDYLVRIHTNVLNNDEKIIGSLKYSDFFETKEDNYVCVWGDE